MKLTMPSNEPGGRRLVVDGQWVGDASYSADEDDWEATLYPPIINGERRYNDSEFVRARRLRDLRIVLQRRIDTDGPWWMKASERS